MESSSIAVQSPPSQVAITSDPSAADRRKSVRFSRFEKVYYTHSPNDYDRTPIFGENDNRDGFFGVTTTSDDKQVNQTLTHVIGPQLPSAMPPITQPIMPMRIKNSVF